MYLKHLVQQPGNVTPPPLYNNFPSTTVNKGIFKRLTSLKALKLRPALPNSAAVGKDRIRTKANSKE